MTESETPINPATVTGQPSPATAPAPSPATVTEKWAGWPGDCVFRVIVPVLKVGSIIGRKGELIKKMCEQTKARIRVLDGPVTCPDRIVLISGKEETEAPLSPAMDAVIRVFKHINGFPEDGDDGVASIPFCSFRLLVPSMQAVSLIGKQGSSIKAIQESGCFVRVLPSDQVTTLRTNSEDKVVDLQGEALKVLKALEAVVGHLRKFLVDHSVLPLFENAHNANATQEHQVETWAEKPTVHMGSHNRVGSESLFLDREPQQESRGFSSGLLLYGRDPGLSTIQSPALGLTSDRFVTQIKQNLNRLIHKHMLTSGSRHNSGPLPPVLPATGLITSGPILSGPLNSAGGPRKTSGPLDASASIKSRTTSMVKNHAVTHLSQDDTQSFFSSFPKLVFWSMVLLFVMGFIAAIFILAAVGNPILLIVVVVLFVIVSLAFAWNVYWDGKAVNKFISEYPDAELRTAKDGQFVKVSGVVTCGNVPLESSFQRVPRCVYTSASLYEYRGWDSKPANPTHRRFTWGLRSIERHAVDFYISDFQSGLRALVKTGYGARVTPYVEESAVIDINPSSKDMSPQFKTWLAERNLSSDDRVMRLKEGYIKEGSSVSVMGVVERNDNVLKIVPPPEPVPTSCQWTTCMLPTSVDGIILRCEDSSDPDVIPV